MDQSSLHCSTMVEESGEMRACAAHRAEHPIRYLRVVPKPIGSLQLRLKIDNCRGEQQGEKALWETWTHLFPHPSTSSKIDTDERIGWRFCVSDKKKVWRSFPSVRRDCCGNGGCGQGCISKFQHQMFCGMWIRGYLIRKEEKSWLSSSLSYFFVFSPIFCSDQSSQWSKTSNWGGPQIIIIFFFLLFRFCSCRCAVSDCQACESIGKVKK